MGLQDRWTRPTGELDARGRPIREHTDRWGQGLRWLATWSDNGTRKTMSFPNKDAAEAHLANVVVDQRAGTYVTPHKQTFGEYGDEWVKAQIHQRDSSAEQLGIRWRRHIRPALGHLRLTEMTRQHVQSAVTMWATEEPDRKALAPSTIAVTYGYVASIMKTAVADRLVRVSPCGRQINLPADVHERVIPLTVEQVRRIADTISKRYVGMVWLGAATGMRGGEMRGLTLDRLRWGDDGSLTVRIDRQLITTAPKWGPPKTDTSDRSITIDPKSAARLRAHLDAYEAHPTGLIFTGREGGPLARTSAATAWNTATEGMSLPGRSGWHMLRHFHASLLIAVGISVTAVADRLGHQDSTETLRTYSHLWPNDESRSRHAIADGLWA